MNVLFIGSSSVLSLIPLKQLLSSSYVIKAVGVYQPKIFNHKIIALKNESVELLANYHQIELLDLSQPLETILAHCQEMAIDLILMSCYAQRLPLELVQFARYGCYNMHPSLLPKFRGPEPIFWQMKFGHKLGVSWHEVVHKLDAGDIVKQQALHVKNGADYATISTVLAQLGAQLMVQLLADIEQFKGSATKLKKQAQEISQASYYGMAQASDFMLDVKGCAKNAFNFMRASEDFPHTFFYHKNNQLMAEKAWLGKALAYGNCLDKRVMESSEPVIYIPFNQGVLVATLADTIVAN